MPSEQKAGRRLERFAHSNGLLDKRSDGGWVRYSEAQEKIEAAEEMWRRMERFKDKADARAEAAERERNDLYIRLQNECRRVEAELEAAEKRAEGYREALEAVLAKIEAAQLSFRDKKYPGAGSNLQIAKTIAVSSLRPAASQASSTLHYDGSFPLNFLRPDEQVGANPNGPGCIIDSPRGSLLVQLGEGIIRDENGELLLNPQPQEQEGE